MTEPLREDERAERPVVAPPASPRVALPVLLPLDLGPADAVGLVCDLDDPDCVQPLGPISPAGDGARV